MVLYSILLSLVMQLSLFSSRFILLEYVQKYSNLLHKLGNYTSWTHSRIDYKHTFSCGKFVFDRFNFLAVSERLLTFSQHFFFTVLFIFFRTFLCSRLTNCGFSCRLLVSAFFGHVAFYRLQNIEPTRQTISILILYVSCSISKGFRFSLPSFQYFLSKKSCPF